MARNGLFALFCVAVLWNPLPTAADPSDSRDGAIAATLAVQTAMQQGREHLLRGDAKAAVYVLESQLTRINGNPAYLAILRDAYRTHVKELRLANQEAAAQLYLQRLQILDPGAVLDGSTVRGARSPAPAIAAAPAPTAPAVPPSKPEPKVRAHREENDDALPKPRTDKHQAAGNLLARAEEQFGNRRFREASLLFEQAHQADPAVTNASRERWAYCKLYRVVDQLNQPSPGGLVWNDLEREVRQAIELAPRLDYGTYLLAEVQKRQGTTATPAPTNQEKPAVVRHFERGTDGWARAETANFRIFHNQPRETAEQVAQVAERTRTQMSRKWFGEIGPDWSPRCDLYLHATAHDYSRATGTPADSPGHSSFRSDGSRVVGRRMDLHCDDPNMFVAILPHETTHVVLAGQFGDQPVPRWADEGMAVLTEPRDKVERHLRNLVRCRQEGQLFHVRQLMQLNDYPDPRYISAFYAQSVSLVEFLSHERSPQVFAQFLREALRTGYEPALQKHYGFRNFDDLQQRWTQKAIEQPVTPAGEVTQGGS